MLSSVVVDRCVAGRVLSRSHIFHTFRGGGFLFVGIFASHGLTEAEEIFGELHFKSRNFITTVVYVGDFVGIGSFCDKVTNLRKHSAIRHPHMGGGIGATKRNSRLLFGVIARDGLNILDFIFFQVIILRLKTACLLILQTDYTIYGGGSQPIMTAIFGVGEFFF